VTYFAAALTRTDDGWEGEELALDTLPDLDAIADALRDLATRSEGGGTSLMFLEEDDEYVAIVRVDGDGEPRVFLSDSRVVETSRLAALLYEEAAVEAAELAAEDDEEDEDDDEPVAAEADPVGDPDLLADLGTPGDTLLELCAEEGMLPADVITAVCEKAGCIDALEALR
jgi:putative tRNA adenosine deaminase-associated protein